VKKAMLLAVALIVVVGSLFAYSKIDQFRVTVPVYQRPDTLVKLPQTWTDEQRQEFHHTAQGTRLLPAAWFRALEQPCVSPSGCGRFADPAYLTRFGFLPSEVTTLNPDGWPIGFALDKDFIDPLDKRAEPVVGLTCAACHTGELQYGKYAIRIEGGPAMIELAAFQKALGLALAFNTTFPFTTLGRYARFERNVLGPDATPDQKRDLRSRVDAFVSAATHQRDVTTERHIYDNQAGFMRTDALTRIGNQVFAVAMNKDAGYAVANAPVRFPQIWNASWLNWVQYNSSIANPLARNIGEALGVRAVINLSGADAGKFESTVNMRGLRRLEDLLAGPGILEGLSSPSWPSQFPPLDAHKVAAGEKVYRTYCQRCHLPPLPEVMADLKRMTGDGNYRSPYWWQGKNGGWYIKVTDVPISYVGTDPRQATDFQQRKGDTGELKKGVVSAAEALDLVTWGVADAFFTKQNIGPTDQSAWMGGRDPTDLRVRAELIYKARPLNGVWANGTYLHNGSVPNLDALLSPDEAARPSTFWVGSRQFDPIKVGYDGAKIDGGSLFDTSKPGNSNVGHRFKDGPKGNGTIGPAFSVAERAQVIEFLKSLTYPGPAAQP
jgi:hypothetical protein